MRQFLTGLLFFFSTISYAQTALQNDSITFCSYKFKLAEGCTTEKNSIKCESYEMGWEYMDERNLKGVSDKEKLNFSEKSFIQFCTSFGNYKKKRITCYLLDTKVKGYKFINATQSIIYASGFVNGRAVTMHLFLKNEANTNDDLPEFPRQIIKFSTIGSSLIFTVQGNDSSMIGELKKIFKKSPFTGF